MSSRIIKFRAWDKENKKMLYNINKLCWYFDNKINALTLHSNLEGYMPIEKYELLQYTGLKDNTKWEDLTEEERIKWVKDGNLSSQWNGRDIYEGDIIENTDYMAGGIYEIKFNNGAFGFDEQSWDYWETEFGIEIEDIKIIGNVYENKELLKEAK